MPYFEVLQQQTAAARADLLAIPVIGDCLAGRVTRAQYLAFLTEAYHHVKHTVPLLMACGSRLPPSGDWLRTAIVEYIAEEAGHEQWILNDIAAAGGDADAVRRGAPSLATELMVAYVYDTVARRNPVGFFGMVHVLEGTSTALATSAAQVIRRALDLPAEAFTYLTSHGSLDQQHVRFFAALMDRLDDAEAQAAVIHTANVVYRLYGDIFRTLPGYDGAALRAGRMSPARNFAVVTGASGGIGAAIASAIAPQCAVLVLVGRDPARLASTAQAVSHPGLLCRPVQADLTTPEGRDAVARAASDYDIDLLINNAGTSEFAWFADQSDAAIERILDVNALAPMLLTRRLLPLLQRRQAATIVNVGSIYGYLGYPGCTSYSASKFALRGFTEALRRELADSPVRVVYFAPRATRTAMNSEAHTALNVELGTAMDAPATVAGELLALLRGRRRERLLGMPEKFFARVNQLLPGLVDNGLRKQLSTIRKHARRGKPRPAHPALSIQSSEGGSP